MEWIDSNTEKPSHGVRVLVYETIADVVCVGRYWENTDCWNAQLGEVKSVDACVSHWMPLPAPPKEMTSYTA